MTVAASTARAIRARRTGFHTDVFAVSVRALKSIQRDPESVLPGLIVPVFLLCGHRRRHEGLGRDCAGD